MFHLADLWYVGVPVIGAAVGATELIARYRDSPFVALWSVPGWWYVFVNASAAFFAYVLIVNFDFKFSAPDDNVALVQALVASLGSMAFFRSSLFSMKVGETDVAVGPAILFQVLLFATDRACDRKRAEPRSMLVNTIMRGVSFEAAREALPSFCFELMQNVPVSEQQQFRMVIDALTSSTKMSDSVKVLNLGLMLMNVVGGQVLAAAVRALGEKIQGPAKLEVAVFKFLETADFAKAYPLLIDVAFIMSKYGTSDEQMAAKKSVLEELKPLCARTDLDNASKMTMLCLSLQQKVGDAVLLAALAYFAGGISLRPPESLPRTSEQETERAAVQSQPQLAAAAPDNVTPIRPDVDPAATADATAAGGNIAKPEG